MPFKQARLKPGLLLPLVLIVVYSSLCYWAHAAAISNGGKIEPIGALTDAGASDALKKAVAPTGYRITDADGTVVCDLWMRAKVANGKNETQGAIYTRVSDSTLIAVISFPKATRDYRRQPLKAGTYTLRYAVHPQDGNHIGISPIRDFLLLVPVAEDQNPETKFSFEELTK